MDTHQANVSNCYAQTTVSWVVNHIIEYQMKIYTYAVVKVGPNKCHFTIYGDKYVIWRTSHNVRCTNEWIFSSCERSIVTRIKYYGTYALRPHLSF